MGYHRYKAAKPTRKPGLVLDPWELNHEHRGRARTARQPQRNQPNIPAQRQDAWFPTQEVPGQDW